MGIYVPTTGPDSWKSLLADPKKHWATGYSARSLAHCWEQANGLPREIANLFKTPAELLIGIPEHKVNLPGGERPSQSDLFALLRVGDETVACTIEGKVSEAFGPTVEEWLHDASEGKKVRLKFLCDRLGLQQPLPPTLRYQLLAPVVFPNKIKAFGRTKADLTSVFGPT